VQAKTIIKFVVLAGALTTSGVAGATPRQLPFSYPYETLSQGELELELYGDMTPLRVAADPANPARGTLVEPAYALQNEFEYGVTDHVELGFYQVFEANPVDGGNNVMQFDGFKWRVRGRLAEAGEWPVDVALYLELETMHDELSLEEKVILAKRVGLWHWMANLWVEETESRPYDAIRSFHFILNPTTGVEYQVSPVFHPGVEFWARGEIGTTDVNEKLHYFVGPTVHLNFGKLWWTFGVYADLTNFGTPLVGEQYGPIWARSVIGLNL
jgi:hypothetical protein